MKRIEQGGKGRGDRAAFGILLAAVLGASALPFAHALAAPGEAAPLATQVTAPVTSPNSVLTFSQPRLLFVYLDANQDGEVSLAEARRIRGFEAAFFEADENRDGKLSHDEFIQAQVIHDRTRGAGLFNDGVISANVKGAMQKDSDLRACDIQVETYDGQVILGGHVDNPAKARKAMEVAAAIAGVVMVKSTLEVRVRVRPA